MIKYDVVDNKYRDFLLNIREIGADKLLHKARNSVFVYDNFVIKKFKKPSFLKSLYYLKKDSKAKRSYYNSIYLQDLAPDAIGYIEFYSKGLDDSYFVSKYFDYDYTIREVLLDKNFEDRVEILKAFAKFTSKLHNKGILHLDYSPGNILIKNKFKFKVVDLNRMKFKKLSLSDRLKNFSMLWISDDDLEIVIDEYARINNINKLFAIESAKKYSFRLKFIKNTKKFIKGRFKDINW